MLKRNVLRDTAIKVMTVMEQLLCLNTQASAVQQTHLLLYKINRKA